VRHQRTKEFEALSRDVIAKVDDAEAESIYSEFIDIRLRVLIASCTSLCIPSRTSVSAQPEFRKRTVEVLQRTQTVAQWRTLIAEYYFESRECRDEFLGHLASHDELRGYLTRARATLTQSTDSQALLPYKLFRADASAQLSTLKKPLTLSRAQPVYPNSPEFAERLINFTRSFGNTTAAFWKSLRYLAIARRRIAVGRRLSTRAGELQAELGDYNKARAEWEQLIPIARGDEDTFLDTATIYWDYFQYDDAFAHDPRSAAAKERRNAPGFSSRSYSRRQSTNSKKRSLSMLGHWRLQTTTTKTRTAPENAS
jgi:hypothetical protein